MDSPDILPPSNSHGTSDPNDSENIPKLTKSPKDDFAEMQEQVIANFQKPNLPNVNVPERIILCLDVFYDTHSTLYRLGDGTTYTPINMMKRVLDFFVHSKNAINKKTEFALIIIKNTEALWVQDFTNNVKDIISAIDFSNSDDGISDSFDFNKIFHLVNQHISIPEYKQSDAILPPPFVVRMVVLYGRSNCLPIIPQEDPYFLFLRKQFYFYIDILLAHEDDCASYRCEEIYDALQDLDNGYSYVFEVSRKAIRIHDCIAKLLAHPLQRPLQKNTDYTFGTRY